MFLFYVQLVQLAFTAMRFSICSFPDPRTAPIIPGQECVVEIPKGSTGLGLSIVGGADTLLVSTDKNGPLDFIFSYCILF